MLLNDKQVDVFQGCEGQFKHTCLISLIVNILSSKNLQELKSYYISMEKPVLL
jgi:hypothetical protein